jgi:hypothetical protein
MQKAVFRVASTAARKNSRPRISSTSALLQDLRQAFTALHQARSLSSTGHPALFLFFFIEYNARKRRASGMLIASVEADIMRKSSNRSV